MKHIKFFEDFISEQLIVEIGSSTAQKYDYKFPKAWTDKNIIKFTTDSGLNYEVLLRELHGFLYSDFKVTNIKDSYDETNRGELYRVMATVMNILKDALKLYPLHGPEFQGIRYEAKAKGADEGLGRDRLYRAYITNDIAKDLGKKVEFVERGGSVFAILK